MSRAALAGVLVCLLTLAGCGALAKLTELQSDLDAAGYSATNINHNSVNGHDTLTIVATMPDGVPTDEDADKIAEIVWTTYPAEFDELAIMINGNALMDASADDLAARFGERPANLGAESGGSSSGPNVLLIVVVVVVALLIAGLVVLVWWRGRRPPPPVAPPAYPYPYQPPPSS